MVLLGGCCSGHRRRGKHIHVCTAGCPHVNVCARHPPVPACLPVRRSARLNVYLHVCVGRLFAGRLQICRLTACRHQVACPCACLHASLSICQPVCISICLLVGAPSVCRYVSLSVCPRACLCDVCVPDRPPRACLCVCMRARLSACIPIYPPSTHTSFCRNSVCISACMPDCPLVC